MQLPAAMIEVNKKMHELVMQGKPAEAYAFGIEALNNFKLTPEEEAEVQAELKARVQSDLEAQEK